MKIKIEAATRIQAADADAAASAFEAYLATLKPKVKWDTKGYLRSGGQILTPPEALKVLKGYFPGLVKGEKNKQSLTELTVNGKKVAMYSASEGDVFILKTPKAVKASQRLRAFEGDDPNGDHERMEHLRAQISDLVDDVAEIKADGDDASHEEDELARRREELEKLEEKTREGR